MLNDHADDDVIVISEEDARYEAAAENEDAAGHDAAGHDPLGPDESPEDNDLAADDQATQAVPQGTPYNGGTSMPPWAATADRADPPSDADMTPVTADVTPVTPDVTPVTADATAGTAHANGHGNGSAIPMPSAETPPAPAPASVTPDSNWPQIQSLFVDDPHSAVEQAAAVAGGAVAALVAAAKNREQTLRDTWQSDSTGTEDLRTALRGYRDLAGRLSTLAQDL